MQRLIKNNKIILLAFVFALLFTLPVANAGLVKNENTAATYAGNWQGLYLAVAAASAGHSILVSCNTAAFEDLLPSAFGVGKITIYG